MRKIPIVILLSIFTLNIFEYRENIKFFYDSGVINYKINDSKDLEDAIISGQYSQPNHDVQTRWLLSVLIRQNYSENNLTFVICDEVTLSYLNLKTLNPEYEFNTLNCDNTNFNAKTDSTLKKIYKNNKSYYYINGSNPCIKKTKTLVVHEIIEGTTVVRCKI